MGQCWPSWAVGPREGHAIHQVFVVLFICAQRLYPIVPPNRYNRYFFLGAKQNPNKQVCLAKVIYSCIHSTSPPCSWYAIHAIERRIFMQSLPLESQGFQGSGQHDGMNVTSTISKGFSQNLKCVKHHKAKKTHRNKTYIGHVGGRSVMCATILKSSLQMTVWLKSSLMPRGMKTSNEQLWPM